MLYTDTMEGITLAATSVTPVTTESDWLTVRLYLAF